MRRSTGYIGTVNVKQAYENPYDTKIEAVYVFPLPEKAAVSEFLMVIGDRTIRGILREKEEAEAIYEEARRQGYRASLLVQRRPNIFEQKVANIEPGKAIDIDITYFHALTYEDGWYSFVFPTVVGPRYNPPGHPDPIDAVRRGGGSNAAGTAVEYLRPEERSGHDISINVRLDAGVEIEEVKASHGVDVSRDDDRTAVVKLKNESTIPNRDFVLDFRVAGERLKSNLLTHRDPETGDGYFTLMVIPPKDSMLVPRQAMEMVFRRRLFGLDAGTTASAGQGRGHGRVGPARSQRYFPDHPVFGCGEPVRDEAGACHGAKPDEGAPLRVCASGKRWDEDDQRRQCGVEFPPRPLAVPLRHVHDRRLHR